MLDSSKFRIFAFSMRKVYFVFVALWGISVCSSCQHRTGADTGHATPYILATTGMIADMLQHIAGDSAVVEALMHPGVDPHLYKASQGDLRKLLDADFIFYNGLHLEGKLASILNKQKRVKPVVAVGEGLADLIMINADTYDPHIWFDVSLWKAATAHAAKELAQLDSSNATYYHANALAYMAQLDTLDAWVHAQLNTIPPRQRVLITAHDAFSYFGRAYGVEVRGLQGISTLSEFGLQDVSALVDYIVDRQIPAVFVESSVSDRSLKAVLAGVQQRGGAVHIGGSLFSDAMGTPGTPEGTYIGMVQYNVNTIVAALSK
ncbi:metal ABC transporter solute-binding protein, Zn/Mn family [Parapedobacter koreensis]|uniref:Manganese/zinc/iron transport system substrate-binding protein n=1 Tax=Parapedobacter koreensis TaxID=332977 RepID=A0A1H7JZ32_9SPHI|nr:zinc ABC transporter substrate-binding protein [Parapedobacter koreensis]SEK79400.1 manganese/zinc/iron transport system substrate-binding protein [Parapedobacter koreensis]